MSSLLVAEDASRVDMQCAPHGVSNGGQAGQKHGECNRSEDDRISAFGYCQADMLSRERGFAYVSELTASGGDTCRHAEG
jgi:hypothetical protein